MNNSSVRLKMIEIKNLKNVTYGTLSFENTRKAYNASILGLYGQNGSGKTALIDSLLLLKFALSGQSVPAFFSDLVNVDAEFAEIRYEFSVENTDNGGEYTADYTLRIRRDAGDVSGNTIIQGDEATDGRVVLFDEVLTYSYECGGVKLPNRPVVDTRTDDVFSPKSKYDVLVGKSKSVFTDLIVAKKLALAMSRSFIFSKELISAIRENCAEDVHRFLFDALVVYGNYELFVINTASAGMMSMNALPLAFRSNPDDASYNNIMVSISGTTTIPADALEPVSKVIDEMNIVLAEIIPGLTIGAKNLGSSLMRSGREGVKIELVSHKNSKEIPLRYESDGIKKIISILQLFIVIYNKPSITVAIDELDSGVFEYLLGELLRIISEKGRGQLIFTSHNLRPLETLDRGFIAFTTTNPENRYIRMSNVKTNNNLRDFYYRDIVLGEQCETVYNSTDNYEIAYAFREAGEDDEP